ncbi:MAG: trimethylamine methyltransferase family protein, partial [Kiritimatiellia bacterium]
MKAEGVARMSRVKIRFLSEEECLVLHHAAEEILARTGVLIELEQARDILSAHGAVVKGDRVWIPAGLVKQALSTVPDEFVLYDRSGYPAMYLGGCRTYYGTGSDTAYTSDPLTGAMVPTNYETVARYTRFTDALPNIDFVMSMGIARDWGSASFVAQYAAMVRNTTKPIVFTAQGLRDIETIYEIMKAVQGGEEVVRLYPRAMLYTEPVSPLRHTKK